MTNKNIIKCADANELEVCKKFLNQYRKENEPDFITDKNGKILKIKNYNSDERMFFYDTINDEIDDTVSINEFDKELLQRELKIIDYYISEKACEKAIKRKEIENKLRLLAFELNGNRDIDWNDKNYKNYLEYSFVNKLIYTNYQAPEIGAKSNAIYCYSERFKNKAVELIGEKDLRDYLINC